MLKLMKMMKTYQLLRLLGLPLSAPIQSSDLLNKKAFHASVNRSHLKNPG